MASTTVTVTLMAMLVAVSYAQKVGPRITVAGNAFGKMGGVINLTRKMSLKDVCHSILMMGGKEALSDGMGTAASWFHQNGIGALQASGKDAGMGCMYRYATGSGPMCLGGKNPGNVFGDYFDTVIEFGGVAALSDPCSNPACNGEMNPATYLTHLYGGMRNARAMGGGMGAMRGMGGMGGMGGMMGGNMMGGNMMGNMMGMGGMQGMGGMSGMGNNMNPRTGMMNMMQNMMGMQNPFMRRNQQATRQQPQQPQQPAVQQVKPTMAAQPATPTQGTAAAAPANNNVMAQLMQFLQQPGMMQMLNTALQQTMQAQKPQQAQPQQQQQMMQKPAAMQQPQQQMMNNPMMNMMQMFGK